MGRREESARIKATRMLRVKSHLPEELERSVGDLIGCCLAVRRELGPGLQEVVYSRALEVELELSDIAFEREPEVPIFYRGRMVRRQRLDFVVSGSIVLEIKSVECLTGVHRAQILGYLRAAHLPVGLLVNFNELVLRNGLKRFVM